jgi:hypothetical protein
MAIWPGFIFANAIRSDTDFGRNAGLANSATGIDAINSIAWKSLRGS